MLDKLIWKYIRLKNVLKGRDFYMPVNKGYNKMTLGGRFNDWTFIPDHINNNSIIYSFGVGHNVSFDVALINNFKVIVHAYDPTPASIHWLEKQNLPDNFRFQPFGLSDKNGTLSMQLPKNESHVSGRILPADHNMANTVEVPVHTLKFLMQQNGHQHIDLLKMDIEGSEYGVIDHLIENNIPVKQLLVEFHHRFSEIGIAKSKQSIKKLEKAGYRLFHVSYTGEEYSFINEKR